MRREDEPFSWVVRTSALAAFVLLGLRGIVPPSQIRWLPIPALVAVALVIGLVGAWTHRRQPHPAPLRRDPATYLLLGALAVLLGVLLSHRFRLTSDGIDHYVYLRSLLVDRDLDLANDYALLSPRGRSVDPATPLGRTGNVHPIGPALIWIPFYLVADLFSRILGLETDGTSALYKNAVSIGGLLYGWVGLLLVYRTAARFVTRAPALLGALGIGFGTFLYWYLAFAPTMAHGPAFASSALFVWLWLGSELQGTRRALALGAALGLCALLRWPNVLLLLLPLIDALPRVLAPGSKGRRRSEWASVLREGAVMFLTALVVFSPQMIVWKRLYGSFLTIPQGAGFLAGAPAYDGVLFSPRHGLFSWSPLLYLGAVGLAWLARREPVRFVATAAFFLALTRVNAGVADWWAGSAFGARRFDAILPLFGLGLAFFLAALTRWMERRPLAPAAAVLGGFLAWNLLLAEQYRSGVWDYSEPVAFEDMGRGAVSLVDRRMGSPFSLPASLWGWLRTRRPPADYESQFMERPHTRWSVRMGVDDRLFLEDGWSEPFQHEGTSGRWIMGAGAGVVVPLHSPKPYTLGARLRVAREGVTGARVRVLVNQRVVGGWDLSAEWSDYEIAVPEQALRAGRNFVRLRWAGISSRERAVAVAGLWLAPGAVAEEAPD